MFPYHVGGKARITKKIPTSCQDSDTLAVVQQRSFLVFAFLAENLAYGTLRHMGSPITILSLRGHVYMMPTCTNKNNCVSFIKILQCQVQ